MSHQELLLFHVNMLIAGLENSEHTKPDENQLHDTIIRITDVRVSEAR